MILPREAGSPAARSPAATEGSEFGTTPDTKPQARLDGVAVWWLTFAAVWTLLLAAGMTFLYKKRNTPTLRLRGLSLTFAGLVLLHLYWLSVQIAYSVGPLAPEVAEFWIMSVWYPFGIALFHAGNSQFLHVAKAQSRFARPPSQMKTRYDEKRRLQKPTWLQRIRQMDYSKRMFMFVTMGMTVQLLIVIIIYMVSRKFHPDFGVPGTEVTGKSAAEIAMKQGRGWEWWPSIVWQFVWAWIVAPIVLWRSRGIRDTHGWQRQTIACCIAGLPAAPMWLIALYVPGMAPVNQYFVPPQWIALSIFVIEICSVFVPCWEVHKHQTLRQETLESIANWESKKRFGAKSETSSEQTAAPPLSPTSTKVGDSAGFDSWKKLPGLESNTASQANVGGVPDDGVLTMAALEHVLDKNPEPLRQFSARRDFSGENIAFLTAVAEWKAALPPEFVRSRFDAASEGMVREQFTRALRIYTEFISPRDAEFPINIAWHDLRKLQGVFERAARSMNTAGASKTVDAATPFADSELADFTAKPPPPPPHQPPKRDSRDSQAHILEPSPTLPPAEAVTTTTTTTTTTTARPRSTGATHIPLPVPAVLPPSHAHANSTNGSNTPSQPHAYVHTPSYALYEGDIPTAFDAAVFDAAQASIKYLVLTNTWPNT
ncbi:6647b2b8-ff0e-429a-a269-2ca5ddaec8df [Thermothielavioides terrestris]|uniref:6647b2b8-ff0e-429a-a269-2ca5ddaec8df n=1 Tax=Thermothielavioides terrestris TaxID=2587410 RepID=A0A3S4AHY3_9PEZI|nr:6647b2b8-ff0e-429a-a269-2ca5ddaec8df [Thermothielavioides terrestris]